MSDNNIEVPRKRPYNTPYSRVTVLDAQKRLGVELNNIPFVTVDEMLATGKHTLEKAQVDATKIVIYEWLSRFLQAEGFPDDQLVEFKEANICDFVSAFLIPVISDLGPVRKIRIYREKGIVATDWETGGNEDFSRWRRLKLGKGRGSYSF